MEDKVLEKLRELSRHKYVRLANCGNAAIFAAIYIAKKFNSKAFILIPDQGGWFSYKTFPKIFNFEVKEIKTDYGIINLGDLEKHAKTGSALLLPSFAGYFAEQPLKQIHEICKKNGCILIEDASGAIGDDTLCNGKYSDIVIGSFGKWKPVNFEEGGFIATSKKEYFEETKEVFSVIRFKPDYKKLLEKLEKSKKRLDFFIETAKKVKGELIDMKVLHREKRGLNAVVKYSTDNEKKKIIDYCNKKGYEYFECPSYIKVEEKAISIEIKRLNPKV